ncbi:hypothetical protein H4R34_000190 [Dimargaris verticillata]|uniref:Arb2 domain-containing protein n=1 Tax=Dimargaris verticillata TaxID=2761393 RepID=A0A9W8BAT0_9FUNG|nr:hypothetical protein H4R34_000190 [Dimargaris verticillata]
MFVPKSALARFTASTQAIPTRLTTLADFGLELTPDGRAVDAHGQPYNFKVHGRDYDANSRRFLALVTVLASLVKVRLIQDCGLIERPVPDSAPRACSILYSPDALTTSDPLMVFAVGSGEPLGVVNKASLVNEGLTIGSLLPIVADAQQNGYKVLILNLYENALVAGQPWPFIPDDFEMDPIPGSDTPDAHLQSVVEVYLATAASRRIHIVTYNDGSRLMLDYLSCLTNATAQTLKDRVQAVAMLAPTHHFDGQYTPSFQRWVQAHSRAWRLTEIPTSAMGAITTDSSHGCDCQLVGAGDNTSGDHLLTLAWPEVLQYLRSRAL